MGIRKKLRSQKDFYIKIDNKYKAYLESIVYSNKYVNIRLIVNALIEQFLMDRSRGLSQVLNTFEKIPKRKLNKYLREDADSIVSHYYLSYPSHFYKYGDLYFFIGEKKTEKEPFIVSFSMTRYPSVDELKKFIEYSGLKVQDVSKYNINVCTQPSFSFMLMAKPINS